jgi:hypothetical protein
MSLCLAFDRDEVKDRNLDQSFHPVIRKIMSFDFIPPWVCRWSKTNKECLMHVHITCIGYRNLPYRFSTGKKPLFKSVNNENLWVMHSTEL